ncbi:unnamed protein product [Parajaminaea phylloscopi]
MTNVVLVGVGGPTCSGKTTLTKHLLALLARASPVRAFIVHQDDFAPPEASLVWNDEVGSADWDDPDTSVDWSRLRACLSHVKEHGELPPDHSSHDELNPLPDLPIAEEVSAQCAELLREALSRQDNGAAPSHLVFLDGFLLYHDREVRAMVDVPIFLRIGRSMLQDRRERRGGYVTAEGETWKDPPLYFDRILWPSHQKAHAHLFQNGDVESGALSPTTPGAQTIRIIEAQDPAGQGSARPMDAIVSEGARILAEAVSSGERPRA